MERSAADKTDATDAALREAFEERNRLWAELQRRRALEEDLAFWRKRAQDLEQSRWWKAGAPLRLAKRAFKDPAETLDIISFHLRQRRRGR